MPGTPVQPRVFSRCHMGSIKLEDSDNLQPEYVALGSPAAASTMVVQQASAKPCWQKFSTDAS